MGGVRNLWLRIANFTFFFSKLNVLLRNRFTRIDLLVLAYFQSAVCQFQFLHNIALEIKEFFNTVSYFLNGADEKNIFLCLLGTNNYKF